MAQAQFEGLLLALMDEDNDKRLTAEKMYMNTKKLQPNEIMQALLHVGRTSSNKHLRSLAVVLLRRALLFVDKDKALFPKLNPQTQTLIKEQLLLGVQHEADTKVRSDFCEATVALAGDIFEDYGQWEGFLEFLMSMAQSTSDVHRHSAMFILSDLCGHLQESFSGANFNVIKQLVASGLASSLNEIRTAALQTSQNIILTYGPEYRKEMQTLLPGMLDCLAACLNDNDEESATEALKNLINLTEHDPGFFSPALGVVLDAMLKIASADRLDDGVRQLALEFVISMTENKPRLCSEVPNFVKSVVVLLLQWMLQQPDMTLQEWNTAIDDDVDIENFVVAQEALDRISLSLPPDVVGPIILEHVPSFLQHQEWQYRYVGAMSLSLIAEGLKTVLKAHLQQIVGLLLPLFSDPHPRVRWSAANACGQLSTDFGPRFQKHFHGEVLPRLISLFGDKENPKVQAHASAALVNFCEKVPASTLKPYLSNLLQGLHTLLQETTVKHVQETAVTAIASVAGCSEKNFTEYYDMFLPILRTILAGATGPDQTLLRGKAMECIALIGIAVGKEKFKNDVPGFMDTLAAIKTMDLDAEDPMRDFVLQTWMKVSSCLGPDFLPYLSYTMPQVLQSAALEAGFSVTESGVLSSPEEDTEHGWDAVDIGHTRIKVHTVALEEKACACNMLLCFASEMKGAFFPYVQEVSKVICPLLTYAFHDGVRSACAAVVPHLLNSVKQYQISNPQVPSNLLRELFAYLFPALLEAMRNESELEVQIVSLEAIHESLAVMESGSLGLDQVQVLTHDVSLLVQMSRQRRAEAVGSNADGDNENTAIVKEELSQEDSFMVELAEIVGALVKYHPDFLITSFQTELLSQIADMIQKNKSPAERQFALCFFDDVVEHGKEKSFTLWPHFMPFMLEYACDPHVGVRQASCYGLGVCAQQGGELFMPYVKPVLELLIKVIKDENSREEDNAPPTENAISSLGKIIVYQESQLGGEVPAFIHLWLSSLPLEVDEIEAKAVHKMLFGLIVGNHPHIFGQDFSNLPQILRIFAYLLREDTPEELTENRAATRDLLVQMHRQMGEILQKAATFLVEEDRAVLSAILSSSA